MVQGEAYDFLNPFVAVVDDEGHQGAVSILLFHLPCQHHQLGEASNLVLLDKF